MLKVWACLTESDREFHMRGRLAKRLACHIVLVGRVLLQRGSSRPNAGPESVSKGLIGDKIRG